MSLPAVTFTHSRGAERIRWWVEGVRLAGLVPIVCDDRNDPLPGTALGWLEANGVEIRSTAWQRRGNLNGTDVAGLICLELADACLRHGSTHALKVDDDTIVLDAELFTLTETAAAVGLTWAGDPRGGAYGMAYALRGDVAVDVARHLSLLPLDPTAPEDLTIWAAAVALAGGAGIVRHEFEADGGPFVALPLGADAREAVECFGVITVGNAPIGGWRNRERQTATRLKQLCNARSAAMQRACHES